MGEYFFYRHIGYGRMAAAMSYNYANVCFESRLIVTGKDKTCICGLRLRCGNVSVRCKYWNQ